MKFVWLFAILFVLSAADGYEVSRFCGQAINNALSDVCKGNLNNLPIKEFDTTLFSSESDVYHFQAPTELTKTRRRRFNAVGIYDECCRLKGCTVTELTAYCS